MAGEQKEGRQEKANNNPRQTADALRKQLGPVMSEPILKHVGAVSGDLEKTVHDLVAESTATKKSADDSAKLVATLDARVNSLENKYQTAQEDFEAKATEFEGRMTTLEQDARTAKTASGEAVKTVNAFVEEHKQAGAGEDSEEVATLKKQLSELRHQAVFLENLLFHALGKLGVELTADDYDIIDDQTAEALVPKEEGS